MFSLVLFVVCFKQKTAYEMRISDWSSDVCSSDLLKRAKNLPQTGFPSLRSVKPDRLLESAYVPNPDPHCARWRVALVVHFRPCPRAARSAGGCGGRSRVGGYAGRGRVVAVGATGGAIGGADAAGAASWEARRVGKEGVRKGRSRWSP